jgi:GAF domain-containing protein
MAEPDELTFEEELEGLGGFEVHDIAPPIFTEDDIAFLEEFDRTIANGEYPDE